MRLALTAALVVTASACGDGASSSTDTSAALDAVAFDITPVDGRGGADSAAPDGTSADVPAADVAGPDITEPSDTATDTAPDLSQPDAVAPSDVASDTVPDTVADTGSDVGPGDGCLSLPGGHRRHLVVSRPYSEAGTAATLWEVFPLEADGTAGPSGGLFDMGPAGRAFSGRVTFRPDGALGITVHDRGEVGLIAIGEDGKVDVVMEATDVGPWVDAVALDGEDLYLVDGNWANNGGGVYRARLGCDGTLGEPALLYPTKLARGLVVVRTGAGLAHLVAAREAVDTTPGHLHRVVGSGGLYTRAAGVSVFPDDEAIVSDFAITANGRHALLGDNSAFSAVDNRVGVAVIGPPPLSGDLVPLAPLSPVDDPVSLVPSPYDDAVLAVLGYPNAVTVLRYSPDAATPFVDAGEPAYVTQAPQLPADAVLAGGGLGPIVYVVENTAVRRFRFNGNGTVTDLGRIIEDNGYTSIPGAIGVQP